VARRCQSAAGGSGDRLRWAWPARASRPGRDYRRRRIGGRGSIDSSFLWKGGEERSCPTACPGRLGAERPRGPAFRRAPGLPARATFPKPGRTADDRPAAALREQTAGLCLRGERSRGSRMPGRHNAGQRRMPALAMSEMAGAPVRRWACREAEENRRNGRTPSGHRRGTKGVPEGVPRARENTLRPKGTKMPAPPSTAQTATPRIGSGASRKKFDRRSGRRSAPCRLGQGPGLSLEWREGDRGRHDAGAGVRRPAACVGRGA
jgi:hypothetical protein